MPKRRVRDRFPAVQTVHNQCLRCFRQNLSGRYAEGVIRRYYVEFKRETRQAREHGKGAQMPKVERLMQLIGLLERRQAVSVEEMSRTCGVSQRTIYRYLNTLSRLDMPVTRPGGRRLVGRDSRTLLSEFDQEDLEVMAYCLGNNPLVEHPVFAERVSHIRQKIVEKKHRLRADEISFSETGRTGEDALPTRESEILERFVRAKATGREVIIETSDSTETGRIYTPRVIKIDREGISLLVSGRAGADTQKFNLVNVVDICLLPQHSETRAEIKVGKVAPLPAKTD